MKITFSSSPSLHETSVERKNEVYLIALIYDGSSVGKENKVLFFTLASFGSSVIKKATLKL